MIFFFFLIPYILLIIFFFFFFNDTATTEIYTLSLHDALPIFHDDQLPSLQRLGRLGQLGDVPTFIVEDRKSTRLNSSHMSISYAVFCLKKKKKKNNNMIKKKKKQLDYKQT